MLDKPTEEFIFEGSNIANYKEKQLSELRKSSIGFVFQSFNLIDELSVYENVNYLSNIKIFLAANENSE